MWDSMEYAQEGCDKMLARAPKHAESLEEVRSEARVCIMQTCLRQVTLHTCVMWTSSRDNRVKLEVFRDPDFGCVSGEWTGFAIDVGGLFPVLAHYSRISIDITVHRK